VRRKKDRDIDTNAEMVIGAGELRETTAKIFLLAMKSSA
jgi:hypothetical protein